MSVAVCAPTEMAARFGFSFLSVRLKRWLRLRSCLTSRACWGAPVRRSLQNKVCGLAALPTLRQLQLHLLAPHALMPAAMLRGS